MSIDPINLLIHRFVDCTEFPPEVNDKVKEKMSTRSIKQITCQKCKQRIADAIVNSDWRRLPNGARQTLREFAVMVPESTNG